MKKSEDNKQQVFDDLYDRYADGPDFWSRLLYRRKKYSWVLVIGFAKSIKRFFDFTLSLTLLLFLTPLFLLIGLFIKLTDGGPILYISTRIGKWGKPFSFPKFRSMHLDAEKRKKELMEKQMYQDGATFKMKSDPRVTWIGKILRKTSLDELPQLWCVVKGDMSLVGPRPPIPEEVKTYSTKDRQRLDIRPGLTCFWQVSGRSDIPFDKQVLLDVEYIKSQSVWTDIKILIKTIPAVLTGRGAY